MEHIAYLQVQLDSLSAANDIRQKFRALVNSKDQCFTRGKLLDEVHHIMEEGKDELLNR